MKNFFKQYQEITIIAAYVCVVAGLVYLVIFPLLSKISEVRDQIQEENLKQEIAKQQLNELPKMQQQYETLKKNEGSINVLLDKNDAVVLIEKLEKMADGSGNQIEISISNAPAAVKTKSTKDTVLVDALPATDYLQIKILLTGNYNSAVNFIQALEQFEYYSDIIGIQVKKNDPKDSPTSATGALSPFNLGNNIIGGASSGNNIVDNTKVGDLTTSLDVVFYTKK